MALTTAEMYFLITSKSKDSRVMLKNVRLRAYLVDSCLLDLAAAGVIKLNEDNRIEIIDALPHKLYFLNSFMDLIERNKDADVDTMIAKLLQNVDVMKHTYMALGEQFFEGGHVLEKKKGLVHKVRTFVPKSQTNQDIIDEIYDQMMGSAPMTVNVYCLAKMLTISRQLKLCFKSRERRAIALRMAHLMEHPEFAHIQDLIDEFGVHMRKVSALVAKEQPASYMNRTKINTI
ncbi:MAG: GPP34 family phosphoprotein [Apilactobacillus sp.]|uniref:GPP34 family phosphoprotein n=1 Tax=Apilactobacillus TaxID=2767877 RepID=UPI0025E06816|nr:GPP34 family phosphoprotein [Apilactobacillus sp.]MCT6823022.1 GPP34 family phosphoprotein [Apilactobacillus sp.]MCT6858453.1 GPP34 family phosphoprotein [Apilactobacillus sp.]